VDLSEHLNVWLISLYCNITTKFKHIAFWGGLGFQNLLGNVYRQLERLHDLVIVWLVVILRVVIIVGAKVLFAKNLRFLQPNSVTLEKTWTLIPIAILVRIAFPRVRLLCAQDSMCVAPNLTVKAVRNQWNWQREFEEVLDHLLDQEALDKLCRFDNPIVLPFGKVTRILVTRTDVLHSLGFPRLGVKLDSAPGRLNATTVESFRLGLLVGSCYELCGRGHSAIPISAIIL